MLKLRINELHEKKNLVIQQIIFSSHRHVFNNVDTTLN